MGNYMSSGYTQTHIEEKIKNITWEIEMYLMRNGYVPFSKMSQGDRKLKFMNSDLKELVYNLRKDDYKIEKDSAIYQLLVDIIEDCEKIVKETPELNDYKLENEFKELCSYFQLD